MAKKKYIHIAEHDLAKVILDKLDIEIEDDFTLMSDISLGCDPLVFKNKYLVLPSYEKVGEVDNSTSILFRPFSVNDHANFIFNLFTDYNDYDSAVFEYTEGKDGKYNGVLTIRESGSKARKVTFSGIQNIPTLHATLILKDLLEYELFKKYIGQIFKIDKRLSDNKK